MNPLCGIQPPLFGGRPRELWIGQPDFDPPDGVAGQAVAIREVEFFADMRAVRIKGAGTDSKLCGDLVIAFGFADEFEDFHFAIGKPFEGRVVL